MGQDKYDPILKAIPEGVLVQFNGESNETTSREFTVLHNDGGRLWLEDIDRNEYRTTKFPHGAGWKLEEPQDESWFHTRTTDIYTIEIVGIDD